MLHLQKHLKCITQFDMMESPFLGPNAQFARNRVFKNRANEIFPGIKSDDRDYLKFTERLADRLTERFVSTQDDEGVNGPEAITGDFYSLRTVSGYLMNPRTLPTVSNDILVDSLGLARSFVSPRHELIFEKLHAVLYEKWTPSDVKIAKVSSSTFPFFRKDVDYKINHGLYVLNNMESICTDLVHGKMEDVYHRHRVMVANAINYRAQVDKMSKVNGKFISKPRLVNDFEYAVSGGKTGHRFNADKSVIVDGEYIEGHATMRVRPVYGMAGPINYSFSAIMAGYRTNYLSKYAYTFKHTIPSQIQSKIARFNYLKGFDVSQFDESVQAFMLDKWMEMFSTHWPEWLVDTQKLMIHAPYYSPPVDSSGGDGIWMGNPFDIKSFKLNVGLPSGVAQNPDLGKFMMTFAYLCFMDDYFQDTIEFGINKVLMGEHPRYGLLDMSDDALILTNSVGFKDYMAELLKEKGVISPYFAAAKEDSVSFLGNVIHRDSPESEIKLSPDVRSYVLNWFVPERGVQDKMREFWASGWFERNNFYAASPAFSDASFIVREEFRSAFGVSPDNLAEQGLKSSPLNQVSARSAIDSEVIMDPSKLFYKYTEDDVSEDVYDNFIAKIPAVEIERSIGKFYKGK